MIFLNIDKIHDVSYWGFAGQLNRCNRFIVSGVGLLSKASFVRQAMIMFVLLTGCTSTESAKYNHPLNTTATHQLILSTYGKQPDGARVIRDLHVFDALEEDVSGNVISTSKAELTVRQPGESRPASLEPRRKTPVLGEKVRSWLEDPRAVRTKVDIWITTPRKKSKQMVSLEYALDLGLIEGRVRTKTEAKELRNRFLNEQRTIGTNAVQPIVKAIKKLGGEIIENSPYAGTVRAKISVVALKRLVAMPEVQRIDAHTTIVDNYFYDVTGPPINGVELMDLLQTEPFYQADYYGNEVVGLSEGSGANVYRRHPGFTSASGSQRFVNCHRTNCSNKNPNPGASHSTGSTTILLGDVTLGQDTGLTDPFSRAQRSGVARRAEGFGVGNLFRTWVVNKMTEADPTIHVLSQSSTPKDDMKCSGETSFAKNWNKMYEAGIALFNSTDNSGHSHPTTCTVSDPAAAIGVFSVGAYKVEEDGTSNIASFSARGGGWGGPSVPKRSIIDITAPTTFEFPYAASSRSEELYGPGRFGGTSAATPAVAGAAVVFRDFYHREHSFLIDSPGILYANLLLMGDRAAEDRSEIFDTDDADDVPVSSLTGFDSLWGAGRLRMRMWNKAGLDRPARWQTGRLCVADGQNQFIDMTPNGPLHPDVNIIKITAWWYDHRHDEGIPHDKIKTTLEYRKNEVENFKAYRSTNTDDNKQRVYVSGAGEWLLRLKFSGTDVTSDDEGCGENATRVYYAFLWEDSSRDDDLQLRNYVRPE
jgi:hypothetical protein